MGEAKRRALFRVAEETRERLMRADLRTRAEKRSDAAKRAAATRKANAAKARSEQLNFDATP